MYQKHNNVPGTLKSICILLQSRTCFMLQIHNIDTHKTVYTALFFSDLTIAFQVFFPRQEEGFALIQCALMHCKTTVYKKLPLI